MQKILLLSQDLQEISNVRALLEGSLPFLAYCSTTLPDTVELINRQPFNLLIYDSNYFALENMGEVMELRARGGNFPVLVTARDVYSRGFFDPRKNNKMHWLQKPYQEKEIIGLIRKLMVSRVIPQQMFKRYRTDQIVDLETLASGDVIPTSMYNLSKGGAYCEHDGVKAVSVGDLIRLRFRLQEVNRDHSLNARVVWTTRKGRFSGRSGLGLKFIRPEDVHRLLMEKV